MGQIFAARFILSVLLASPIMAVALDYDQEARGGGSFVTDAAGKIGRSLGRGSETARAWAAWRSGDPEARARIFDMARNGNTVAQNLAGYMLDNGDGVQKNSQKAYAYFKASARENPIAKYNLAVLHMYGRGAPKDEARAIGLYREAYEVLKNGHSAMQLALHHYKRKEQSKAKHYAAAAAKDGNAVGCYLYGRILFEERAYREAYTWLMKGAEAGDINAPALLSRQLEHGLGTDKNRMMAGAWHLIHLARKENAPNRTAGSLSMFHLSDEESRHAVRYAENWLANHKPPKREEFSKTVYMVKGRGMS